MPVDELKVTQVNQVGYFKQGLQHTELADVRLEPCLVLNQQSSQRIALFGLHVDSLREVHLLFGSFGALGSGQLEIGFPFEVLLSL